MVYSKREQSFGFILFGWARAGAIVTSLISTATILALGYQDAGCSSNGLSLPKPNISSQWNASLNMTTNITGTVSCKICDILRSRKKIKKSRTNSILVVAARPRTLHDLGATSRVGDQPRFVCRGGR